MHTLNKTTLIFAMGLSALAGYVDAIGFLELGRVFVSFMSGNSTQLAVGWVHGDATRVILLGKVIICFVAGASLGTVAGHFTRGQRAFAVLMLVSALLATAASCYGMGLTSLAILFVALAMGAENAVFQREGEVAIGLTYMTGTLVKLGQRLANAMLGGDRRAWQPYLFLWIGLMAGGVAGVLAYSAIGGMQGLWIAAAWAATLAFIAKLKNIASHA